MRKIGLAIAVFMFLLLFFIPNFAEFYIEKEDRSLVGRELLIGDIDINYFTGNVSIESLYMLEVNAKDTFAGFELLEINLGVLSSISGEYAIESLDLINPHIRITEYDSTFNFSDLIPSTDTTVVSDNTAEDIEPVMFNFGTIKVRGLNTKYTDRISGEIEIDSLDITLNPLAWDQQILSGDLFVSLRKGGDIGVSFDLDIPNGDYSSEINIENIILHQFSHFIRPFVNIQHIDGAYSSQFSLEGNYLNDTTDLTLKGNLLLEDFRLLDSYSIELIAFDSLFLDIDSIDLKSNEYRLNQFALSSPTINYAFYPTTDSFSELIYAEDSVNSKESSDSLLTAEDSTSIYYSINKVAITNGALGFDDHTLVNHFNYSIDAINIMTDSLDSSSPQSELSISALLNYLGELKTKINFDLDDPKDFAYQATIDSLSIQDFSPYSIQFVGNAVTKGLLYFKGTAATSAHFLKSDNELMLHQLKLGDKIKHDKNYNLPVKAAVSLLKNPKGEIKIKLPIRGNLDDPSFKVGRTVLNTLKNLVIKTVASPITVLGKVVTSTDKNINEIPYRYLQTSFTREEKSLIKNISNSIKERRGHQAIITQYTNPLKEKASIALFEAKKLFHSDSTTFTNHQAQRILPIDSLFQVFINQSVPEDSVMSLAEKCILVVGEVEIDLRYNEIVNLRNERLKGLLTGSDHIEIRVANENLPSLKTRRPVFKIVAF